MKKINKQIEVFSKSAVAFLFALSSFTVSAGSDEHKHETKPSVSSLSKEVRGLLAQEMQFIDKAMKDMFSEIGRASCRERVYAPV